MASASNVAVSPASIRVWVVEDEETIREALVEALEYDGCRAIACANGSEAWDRLEAAHAARGESPDVILLDYMMPVMGGAEFLARLRKDDRWKGIPVIVFSAAGNQAEVPGATEYLRKPVRLEKLFESVRRYRPKG